MTPVHVREVIVAVIYHTFNDPDAIIISQIKIYYANHLEKTPN